jgi:Ca-activated chloride channel homolog
MQKNSILGLMFAIALMCAFFANAIPVHANEFTADIVITGPGDSYTFKLYVKDHMYRLKKVTGPMNIPPYPSIVNRDTGVSWGLNPQIRQYVEITDIKKTFMMNPLVGWAMTREGMIEKPGPAETVNGYECETWLYTMPGKSETAAKVWISKKLRHLIRDERFGTNKNPVLELKSIEEGPVNSDLFKIPEGYKKMVMKKRPGPKTPHPAASSGPTKSPEKNASASSPAGNLMFILDASGSMWGQVEGKAKIVIAKEVLTGLIKDLPDDATVGLVAYGHRRKGDCNDVEELVPLGKIDKNKLTNTIQGLSPKGKTPISRSVRMTAERIKHLENETTIILVSDGKETCDPDPCGLVKELKETGIRFVMHVIGFDVTEEEKAQLECMAMAGGGEYFTAKNAKDFQLAAKEVVKKAAEKPPVSLKVTSIKNGKPFKTYVQILTGDNKKQVAEGWTSEEKPAAFRLSPGMYDIRARDMSVIQNPTVDIKNVEIIEDQTTEKIADFATEGILHVKAVKNNAPCKTYVKLFRQDDGKYIRDGWTREDGTPAEYKILPGNYKISLQDQSVQQRPVVWIENVEVKPGQTVERIATFGQGGILHVKAVKNNAPCKTYVKVFRQDDGKYIRDGWTREDGKPAEYKLLPGIYKIWLQDPSVKQRPVIWIENVEIKADRTLERFGTFVAGGILNITATKSGAPYKAYVKLYSQEDDKYMGDGWALADGKAAQYKLLPGVYYAKVEDRTDRSLREIRDIKLQSGKTLAVNAAFPVEKEPQAASETPAPEPKPAPAPEPKAMPKAAPGPQTSGDTVMNGEAPLYPGAKVLNDKTYGKNTKAELEVPATPEDIINFYKQAMTAKGWQPGMSMVQGNKGVLMLTKPGGQMVISATGQGQKSKVTMALINK